jgi:glutamate-1-semialdehyde 2,1-aminomutase
VAAVAGHADIMDQLKTNKVVAGGTFNGYPLGISAALTTMKILERDNGAIYKRVDHAQDRLMQGLREIFKRRGMPVLVQGVRGLFVCHFIDKEVAYSVRDLKKADMAKPNELRIQLADESILIMWGGRWYVTGSHTDEDIDKTLECADRAVSRLA